MAGGQQRGLASDGYHSPSTKSSRSRIHHGSINHYRCGYILYLHRKVKQSPIWFHDYSISCKTASYIIIYSPSLDVWPWWLDDYLHTERGNLHGVHCPDRCQPIETMQRPREHRMRSHKLTLCHPLPESWEWSWSPSPQVTQSPLVLRCEFSEGGRRPSCCVVFSTSYDSSSPEVNRPIQESSGPIKHSQEIDRQVYVSRAVLSCPCFACSRSRILDSSVDS